MPRNWGCGASGVWCELRRHDVRHNANNAATSVSDSAGGILRSMSRTWSEAFPRGQWADQVTAARSAMHWPPCTG